MALSNDCACRFENAIPLMAQFRLQPAVLAPNIVLNYFPETCITPIRGAAHARQLIKG